MVCSRLFSLLLSVLLCVKGLWGFLVDNKQYMKVQGQLVSIYLTLPGCDSFFLYLPRGHKKKPSHPEVSDRSQGAVPEPSSDSVTTGITHCICIMASLISTNVPYIIQCQNKWFTACETNWTSIERVYQQPQFWHPTENNKETSLRFNSLATPPKTLQWSLIIF